MVFRAGVDSELKKATAPHKECLRKLVKLCFAG